MSWFGNTNSKKWNSETKMWDGDKEFITVSEVKTERNQLVLDFYSNTNGEQENFRLQVPMTPQNIETLEKQLEEAKATTVKETDKRGRINLGVDYSNKEVEILVLNSTEIEDEEN